MRTKPETINGLLRLLSPLDVRVRKMFGEYALYCDEKVVALVCRDELFVKDTPAGSVLANGLERAPAYPGVKPGLHVTKDHWDDTVWLAKLIQTTADALTVKK